MEKYIFSWVHVSDLHFGQGCESIKIDQNLVLSKLREDIKQQIDKHNLNVNAIFITGDIAFSGKEYRLAEEWIDGLSSIQEIEAKNIYMVPGNHDIQRESEKENRNLRRLVDNLRSGIDNIDDAYACKEDLDLLQLKFQNYRNFAIKYLSSGCKNVEDVYWYCDKNSDSMKIKIVGLNTAILAKNDDDKQKLRLGKFQIKALAATDPDELLIVLTHHPLDWLGDSQDVTRWLESKKHIHLSGHLHDQETKHIQRGGGAKFIKIMAGAAHTSLDGFSHSYNLASILSVDDKIFLRIWPRLWSDKNKEFRVDVDLVSEGSSYTDHPLDIKTCNEVFLREKLSNEKIERDESYSIPVEIRNFGCDSPPTLPAWVGRHAEIDLLDDPEIRVFAITGIGGQGKSALAARHVESMYGGESDRNWDWRDCREEGDTLRTHLIRIVERLTSGAVKGLYFSESKIEEIIDYLFGIIHDEKWIFVFDNVDHYVDLETNQPILGMNYLINCALTKKHFSKFIFTCRPKLLIDNPLYFNMILGGLSQSETLELFEKRGVKTETHQIKRAIAEAHSLTNGHPLWINLIATQVAKDKSKLETLIYDIREGVEKEIPKTMLRTIWKTLTEKQITILRYMAETVRPETEEQIGHYISDDMTWNRFSRTLRSLKDLNLVIVKSAPRTKDTLDLHPLVRSFITTEFPRVERRQYIVKIASFFDKLILKLTDRVSKGPSFSMMENWICRAELALNAGLYEDALKALDDVATPLLGSGYQEEFVRIASKLFIDIDFSTAIAEEYNHFDSMICDYVDVLSNLGRYKECEEIIDKYEKHIPGKSSRYVNLCDMKTHHYWVKCDYEKAKFWGGEGVKLVHDRNLDTKFDCSHNMALAQRDSGEVDKALEIFKKGIDINEIFNEKINKNHFNAPYFGNIGRCLWLKNDIDMSLRCFVKAAKLLENETSDKHSYMNKGWASLWIAENLEHKEEFENAIKFYMHTFYIWESIAPNRARQAFEKSRHILKNYFPNYNEDELKQTMIESFCSKWINKNDI